MRRNISFRRLPRLPASDMSSATAKTLWNGLVGIQRDNLSTRQLALLHVMCQAYIKSDNQLFGPKVPAVKSIISGLGLEAAGSKSDMMSQIAEETKPKLAAWYRGGGGVLNPEGTEDTVAENSSKDDESWTDDEDSDASPKKNQEPYEYISILTALIESDETIKPRGLLQLMQAEIMELRVVL